MDRTLVFIDAGFLSKLKLHFGKGKYLNLDFFKFAEYLSKKEYLICDKIFYYTAPPFQSSPVQKIEERKKEKYDKFKRKLEKNGLIFREGRCQRLKIDGKFRYSQKGVDVLMTMDLVNVPQDFSTIKKIILIASDSDFVPVIQDLCRKGIKVVLYTYYEKKRNSNFSRSNDLIKAVSKYVKLKKEDFINCELVDKKRTKDEK